jgi:mono/diheme cytochrome c family protein
VNWVVVAAGVLALLALRLVDGRFVRVPLIAWLGACFAAIAVVLRWGFVVPIPASVLNLYLAIVAGALAVYATTDRERLQEVTRPLVAFLTERRFVIPLILVALAIPAAVAAKIYRDLTSPPVPPFFGRTIHPAPPNQITVHDKVYDLTTLSNPHRALERTNPALYRQKVEAGRVVYYANCFYCHGDLMRGEGMFAHALLPVPTNFQDPGTIAQLQEDYLFWRVAKGGPGLPEEAGPWSSAMPAWDQFLDDEQIWDVILFLYEFTGNRPRARHAVTATSTHE